MKTHAFSIATLALLLVAPTAHAQKKITYEHDVLPVLRDKCLGCHNADKTRGGLDASSYGKLMEGGSSGEVVKPGDLEGSRIYKLVTHADEPKMPPQSAMLPQASLDVFKAWIEQGALENAGSKAVVIQKKVDVAKAAPTRGRPAVVAMPVNLPRELTGRGARANAAAALAVSPWAPIVAVAGPHSVLLYHTDTLELLGVLPFTHGQVNVLRFSRSGDLLLAAGGRGGKSGKAALYEVKTGKLVTELGDELDAVVAADLSPDQSMVALGGANRLVRVYATNDGTKVHELKKHTEWVTAVEFSPDGVLLATGDRNGGLQIWEAGSGREYFTLNGHKGAITGISWRDDGNQLLSSSEDGTVRCWEMVDGKQVRSTAAHPGGALAVDVGHDNRFASVGRDSKVKLFDANGGSPREFAGLGDVPLRVAISHDGSRLLAGDWSGAVHVWSTADARHLGTLSTRPPTREEELAAARSIEASRQKAVESAQAALAKLTADLEAARARAGLAQAEMAKVQKAAAESQAFAAQAKGRADALAAAQPALEAEIVALPVKVTAYTVAMHHIKAEADTAKGNAALAKALADAQKLVGDTTKELSDKRAALVKLTAELPGARQAADAAQKRSVEIAAKLKQLQGSAAGLAKHASDLAGQLGRAKASLERLVADRDAAKAVVQRLSAESSGKK